MKTILVLLALAGALALSIVFFPSARASAGPEPIAHGKVACARCRMHVGEPGFAGQMRDASGELTTYDDLGCLLIAMWKKRREVPGVWVEAHESGRLVPLVGATLVVDSSVRTPMGYGIIAFEDAGAADIFTKTKGGEIRPLEVILKDGKRFRE